MPATRPTLRRTIFEAEPGLLSSRIEPMRESIDALMRSWRLGATLFTIFGALALVIGGGVLVAGTVGVAGGCGGRSACGVAVASTVGPRRRTLVGRRVDSGFRQNTGAGIPSAEAAAR